MADISLILNTCTCNDCQYIHWHSSQINICICQYFRSWHYWQSMCCKTFASIPDKSNLDMEKELQKPLTVWSLFLPEQTCWQLIIQTSWEWQHPGYTSPPWSGRKLQSHVGGWENGKHMTWLPGRPDKYICHMGKWESDNQHHWQGM